MTDIQAHREVALLKKDMPRKDYLDVIEPVWVTLDDLDFVKVPRHVGLGDVNLDR